MHIDQCNILSDLVEAVLAVQKHHVDLYVFNELSSNHID